MEVWPEESKPTLLITAAGDGRKPVRSGSPPLPAQNTALQRKIKHLQTLDLGQKAKQ